MFDKLREMTGGDENRLNMYVQLFLSSMPENKTLLENAIKEKDPDQLNYAIHECKPLLKTLGFDDLFTKAEQIEVVIRNKKIDDDLYNQAKSLLVLIKELVDQLNNNHF